MNIRLPAVGRGGFQTRPYIRKRGALFGNTVLFRKKLDGGPARGAGAVQIRWDLRRYRDAALSACKSCSLRSVMTATFLARK